MVGENQMVSPSRLRRALRAHRPLPEELLPPDLEAQIQVTTNRGVGQNGPGQPEGSGQPGGHGRGGKASRG